MEKAAGIGVVFIEVYPQARPRVSADPGGDERRLSSAGARTDPQRGLHARIETRVERLTRDDAAGVRRAELGTGFSPGRDDLTLGPRRTLRRRHGAQRVSRWRPREQIPQPD